MAVELTKDTFEEAIANSAKKPMFMDFWGPKCTHCLALMPSVEKLAEKVADKVDLCKVNISGNRRVAMALKVMSLPSFLFFKDGKEVEDLRLTGDTVTIEQIEANVNKIM
ncbi:MULTISPECIES: thioredoxin family protein [Jonquetella]|uniref:Thioredoxin n=1 Tax=Jonquetella anthropi DSM 22815 TaxID=885272 RepID=H0UKR2_9BACT|nr:MULTISPECIES: thioredoxin family protein [Jonquetella]EEX48295.1 thioredoxin [Jonquetella anthropi E3_33 E1]EHM13271.1 thioredoxin domain-containing protein [Jonquetella anthropi DSM 22815]ERL23598.1 putative thioredoxin [Jonquetella sp. BV3C21]